jgi:Chaperone of endosialidase
MHHPRRLLSVALLACLSGIATGQEIKNWAAPALWSPPAKVLADDALSPQEAEAIDGVPTPALHFVGLTPCRLVDTRGNGFTGDFGPPALAAGVPRTFFLTGECGIGLTAEAVSLNVTVTDTQGPGFILIYPEGGTQPAVSTLNYVAGQTVANAAVVPLGETGGITVIAGVSGTNLILDTNGDYRPGGFLPAGTSNQTLRHNGTGWVPTDTLKVFTTSVSVAGSLNLPDAVRLGTGCCGLFLHNSGSQTTYVGYNTGVFGGGGTGNVGIGYQSIQNTTGSGNIAIGNNIAPSLTSGSNNLYIGNPGSGNESGQIRIGTNGVHTQGTVIASIHGFGSGGGIPVIVNSGGRLGTTTSSARFKEGVRDIGIASDGLMNLRPVAFKYKSDHDASGLTQYGLIAEEVAEVYPELVVYDDEGRPQAIRSQLLDPLLLSELQKQRREIEDLKAQLGALQSCGE